MGMVSNSYILGGIGLGALIHGYVPEDIMATFVGVVAAVILLVDYVFNVVL